MSMVHSKKTKPFFFYLSLSLFFHSFFIYFIYSIPQHETSKPDRSPTSLFVMSIADSENRDLFKESTAKQIVEQNPDLSNTQDSPNKNAKFLSQYHQKAPKETVSKKPVSINKTFKDISESKLVQKASKQAETILSQQKGLLPDLSVADLIPKTDWNQYMDVKKIGDQQGVSENSINFKNEVNLGFQSSDYLKDIEEGEQTLLNTRAFKFYTYYNRIKQQVQTSWKSMIKKEVRKLLLQQRESILGAGQRTSLLITLDRFGALVSIKVLKKSHITILDHIAVKSFQLTAPFPHPPKGLIGEKEFLQIRWDFILENV